MQTGEHRCVLVAIGIRRRTVDGFHLLPLRRRKHASQHTASAVGAGMLGHRCRRVAAGYSLIVLGGSRSREARREDRGTVIGLRVLGPCALEMTRFDLPAPKHLAPKLTLVCQDRRISRASAACLSLHSLARSSLFRSVTRRSKPPSLSPAHAPGPFQRWPVDISTCRAVAYRI